jgi:uncharacterized protein
MLIEFTVGNYKSFKEPVTLSMEAAKITAKEKRIDEQNTFTVDDHTRLLKSAAVYGANASGKSNVADALRCMRHLVINSSRESQASDPIAVEPFLLSEATVNQPSFFEIVFLLEGTQYRYGFEVDRKRVQSEWLFYVPRKRESRLFERQGDQITLSGVFKEGKDLPDKTRPNALFLSVVAQFNGKIAQSILMWFRNCNIISGLQDAEYLGYTLHCLDEGEHRDEIVELIRKLDLSIQDVRVEKASINLDTLPLELRERLSNDVLEKGDIKQVTLSTYHQRYNLERSPSLLVSFDFETQESEGTRKIIALAGPLLDTLKQGKVLVVDEFDARLHPLISLEIIKLFHTQETNPHNAQLLLMTHDTNLLDKDLFRRDQIWFTEKDRYGASVLYSLVEYKVRNDEMFEKNYIQGKYGAIPFIGDLRQVLGGTDAH